MALAERKSEFDQRLSERKVELEVVLAEKKIGLDRVLAASRRRAELAEEVLSEFYEARDVIASARQPFSFGGEGKTRKKSVSETEEMAQELDVYYVTIERMETHSKLFSRLFARRSRFQALFGREAAKPFDDLSQIRHEIASAVRLLMQAHRSGPNPPAALEKWQTVIGWGSSENDPFTARLEQIIEAVEQICQPAIQVGAP